MTVYKVGYNMLIRTGFLCVQYMCHTFVACLCTPAATFTYTWKLTSKDTVKSVNVKHVTIRNIFFLRKLNK